MTLFTCVLDLCLHNQFRLRKALFSRNDMLPHLKFQQFKRRIMDDIFREDMETRSVSLERDSSIMWKRTEAEMMRISVSTQERVRVPRADAPNTHKQY